MRPMRLPRSASPSSSRPSAATSTHKTEVGGVALGIKNAAEAAAAAARLGTLSQSLLVEEMIVDGVAEILLGVSVDPQFGPVLVLGAGGVLAELLADTVSLLPPWTAQSIEAGLRRLRAWQLLVGFAAAARRPISARSSRRRRRVAHYATAHRDEILEIDVNPADRATRRVWRPGGRRAYSTEEGVKQ